MAQCYSDLGDKLLKDSNIDYISWNSGVGVPILSVNGLRHVIPVTFDESKQYITQIGVLYDSGVEKWCLRVSYIYDSRIHNANIYFDYNE